MKQSLTQLAAQIESAKANADWAAHKAEFAKQEAAQEEAAYRAKMERDEALIRAAEEAAASAQHAADWAEREAGEPDVDAYGKLAEAGHIRDALTYGGRAVVTMKSHKTGKHVTLTLVCRKKAADGGWVSRATTAGRVGIGEADCIEVRDPDREYPANYVGRMYLTGSVAFRAGKEADPARAYAAEKILGFALDGEAVASEIRLATQCSYCGHQLSDPESIERGIGPECYGKHTSSQVAPHAEGK